MNASTPVSNYSIFRRVALLAALGLFLVGCGGNPYMDDDGGGADRSLVYGYIDMDEAPAKLQWVSMKQLRPKVDKPYYSFWIREGAFYTNAAPPGVFKFDSFGGHNGWTNTNWTFSFPSQGRGAFDPVIKRPGMYYVGSWKYKKVKTGFFKPGKFDLVPDKKVSEKDVLKRMLPWAKHKKWKDMIEARIRQLGG